MDYSNLVMLLFDDQGKKFLVFECSECYCLLPYDSCPHNCPENLDNEDEGFVEDLETFKEELAAITDNQ